MKERKDKKVLIFGITLMLLAVGLMSGCTDMETSILPKTSEQKIIDYVLLKCKLNS